MALIAFMPSNPSGAIGSVDYPKEERRALATKSRESPPKFGSPERQKVIDEVCTVIFPFLELLIHRCTLFCLRHMNVASFLQCFYLLNKLIGNLLDIYTLDAQ